MSLDLESVETTYEERQQLKRRRRYLSLLREKKRRRGLNDLHYFCKHILDYEDITSKDRFHGELCEFVSDENKRKLLILEPRGSLKTSISTVAYPLQQIVKNPNIRILLCSEELLTAQKFVAEIVAHIEENQKFISLYGDLKGKSPKKWNEKEIVVAGRTIRKKEPTLTAAGIDVTKTGLHYDLIIIDDPHSEKNTGTREQIEKVIKWYRQVLSLLDPNKRLIVIGTRWNYDDLFGYLIEKEHERKALKRKKRFHILKKTAVEGPLNDNTPDEKLLWPERLSLEFLQDQLLDQGPYIFSCFYRNEPVDDESATFRRSWIKFYNPLTLPNNNELITFATLDPVRDDETDSTTDDHAAIAVVSFDAHWIGYIREIRRGKWDEYETIENLLAVNRIWKPQKIGVEAVAWQKVYYRFLKKELDKRKSKLPIAMLKTDNRTTKHMRIRSMVPYWKTGLYRVPGTNIPTLEGNMAIFMNELVNYPRVKTKDCIDALAYIDQISKRPKPSQIVKMYPAGSIMDEIVKMRRKNYNSRMVVRDVA